MITGTTRGIIMERKMAAAEEIGKESETGSRKRSRRNGYSMISKNSHEPKLARSTLKKVYIL